MSISAYCWDCDTSSELVSKVGPTRSCNSRTLLLILSQFPDCSVVYLSVMAQVSMNKALMAVFTVAVVLSAAATVSAQDTSQAPAPSPDAGSAFSLPLPGVFIVSSLFFSLLALLKPWDLWIVLDSFFVYWMIMFMNKNHGIIFVVHGRA